MNLYLPLLNPVLQTAVPLYTFSKSLSSGLPCIPKQKNVIASHAARHACNNYSIQTIFIIIAPPSHAVCQLAT